MIWKGAFIHLLKIRIEHFLYLCIHTLLWETLHPMEDGGVRWRGGLESESKVCSVVPDSL